MSFLPKILVVDDKQQNIVAMQAVLGACTAEIITATSGNEALASLLRHDFALVLLDVQMPEMDGYEVAELMRANPSTSEVPIIFVTAISKDDHYVFKGYDSGAVDFLSKPIAPHILCSKVNIFLELWLQRQRLSQTLKEKEKLTEQLKLQAEFDELTGLPNRKLFNDRLRQAVMMCQRQNTMGALMFIDLDHFKEVNDSLGHDAGDDLLIQVAARLAECVRKTDTVARIGGDEFTVIFPDVQQIVNVEHTAVNILEALCRPFLLGKHTAHISGSIGVALFPEDSGVLPELVKMADTAMYGAKEGGRNQYRFYTSDWDVHVRQRRKLESQLQQALTRNEFLLHYQPRFNLRTGHIVGMEALIRWQKSNGELILPEAFIPVAEEADSIAEIGNWVLEESCRQLKECQKVCERPLTISVNISKKQFTDRERFFLKTHETFVKTEIDPKRLELELTESAMMDSIPSDLKLFNELKELGVMLAIDDFGTGYSSIAWLRYLPISTVKITRNFITTVDSDPNSASIVRAIISIAHQFSHKVVAVGVETQSQLDFLRQNDCDMVQGYHLSPPVPSDELDELLNTNPVFKG